MEIVAITIEMFCPTSYHFTEFAFDTTHKTNTFLPPWVDFLTHWIQIRRKIRFAFIQILTT